MKTRINYKDVNWIRVKNKCRTTVNKENSEVEATTDFKKKLLISEHSPIRVLRVDWHWDKIPYAISTHYVRHHEGVEKWVGTERSDRTGVDRTTLSQMNPVPMDMEANQQALINMAKVRLCCQASKETREFFEDLKITLHNDEDTNEMADVLVPNCIYRCGCPEGFVECKFFDKFLDYATKEGSLSHITDIQKRYNIFNRMFYEKQGVLDE